ncbi:MAG: hypothetical protein DWQ44_01065 [Bacteroidetes bacterium]|nr:MAG: hypothetical protein DWQ44_01065 [Bacteroidota bacterium]
MQYRAGFNYSQTFLQLNESRLNEYGISLGLGLPVKRVGTTVHFAAEAGMRGTVDNNLVRENYLRFSLGFTLNDRWFIKPRYD